jgi:hypothetical protein
MAQSSQPCDREGCGQPAAARVETDFGSDQLLCAGHVGLLAEALAGHPGQKPATLTIRPLGGVS